MKGNLIMATKEEKNQILDLAHGIAEKYAQSGSNKVTPSTILENYYNTYLKLYDNLDKKG